MSDKDSVVVLDELIAECHVAFWSDGTDGREPIRKVPEGFLRNIQRRLAPIRESLRELEAAELAYWRARATDCKGVAHRNGCDGDCRDRRLLAADALVHAAHRASRPLPPPTPSTSDTEADR